MKKINDIWKGYKKYFTYDSGEKSFLIYIKQKNVYIYKKDLDDVYNNLVAHYIPLKIFIGKTPLIKMQKYSISYGKNFDGNTILLLLTFSDRNM